MRRPALLVVAAVALAGARCSFIVDTRGRCAADADCLDTERCADGFCTPRAGQGGGSGGGGGAADAALCARLGVSCDAATGTDTCGVQRTVTRSGTCTQPRTASCGTCTPCGDQRRAASTCAAVGVTTC